MTTTFEIYGQYAFVATILLSCVYHILATGNPALQKLPSTKERFYNLCKLTNYHAYQDVVLFCSLATDVALTTTHLIAYSKQGASTFTSKIIPLYFIKNVTSKANSLDASTETTTANIIVTETDGTVHLITMSTTEAESFMQAWQTRPNTSIAYVG